MQDYHIDRQYNYKPKQMIFIDKSGSHTGTRLRLKEYLRFILSDFIVMLLGYTLNGVIYCEVYYETMDAALFQGFIEKLLPFCGRYLEPKPVVFLDNASFPSSLKP
ncbi:unnamed protein product [Fusarium venenatum]|uniref:Tc1-like transposase DDE domain-containing protein n=1 Tax=Fusarium venenatum TaxID=56646 RepID=A0A2L2U043_9HYPO|nr:uncharacterized protein FVRRES_11043 [Fusarium venenatum]CEI70966.1 unnamed protein product [Fusarium venenatum]